MLSNVLITGESNLDERSGQLNRGAYILKIFVTKLVLYNLDRFEYGFSKYEVVKISYVYSLLIFLINFEQKKGKSSTIDRGGIP